jgi:hypothetical protein
LCFMWRMSSWLCSIIVLWTTKGSICTQSDGKTTKVPKSGPCCLLWPWFDEVLCRPQTTSFQKKVACYLSQSMNNINMLTAMFLITQSDHQQCLLVDPLQLQILRVWFTSWTWFFS